MNHQYKNVNTFLVPDIVLSLEGNLKNISLTNKRDNKIITFLRTDKEKGTVNTNKYVDFLGSKRNR